MTQVQLGYDTSLFTGTGWNPPDWRGTYTNMVTPTSSLWIDKGLVTPPSVDSVGVREADPSRKAADVYAEALRGQGITVNGVTAQQAPASATEIATHHSRTLSDIVEQVLVHSDNDGGAEVLFRQIGRSGGRSGSIADAQTATRETLQQLGGLDRRDEGGRRLRTVPGEPDQPQHVDPRHPRGLPARAREAASADHRHVGGPGRGGPC